MLNWDSAEILSDLINGSVDVCRRVKDQSVESEIAKQLIGLLTVKLFHFPVSLNVFGILAVEVKIQTSLC